MSGRLAGKVVAITGAGSGLGRAMALRVAREGGSVAVAGRNRETLDETVAAMAELAGDGIAIPTDVAIPEQVSALIDGAVEHFGRLDAAIANSGTFVTRTSFQDWDLADWQRSLDVNLTGAFLTLQAAAKVLIAQGEGGSLLATGSSTAVRPAPGILPYVSSKAGLHVMMRALAVELAPLKIRVNTIVPGMSRTPPVTDVEGFMEAGLKLAPMGEVVEPEEIAALVAFALSDEAPHMTGAELKIDAGRTSA